MLAVLAVRDQAVATSATYERGQHLWDARTGRAAIGLTSVTVVADDLTWADALATAVFALGPDGVAWAAEHDDCHVLAWSTTGRIITSGGVRSLLAHGNRCDLPADRRRTHPRSTRVPSPAGT